MTIHEIVKKFKELALRTDILLSGLIILVSLVSFMLGRETVAPYFQDSSITQQKSEIVNDIVETKEIRGASQGPTMIKSTESTEGYVASKNGTKYHLPWCSGAKRIKEENKVYFGTKEEAEKAGYTPASNCKGI